MTALDGVAPEVDLIPVEMSPTSGSTAALSITQSDRAAYTRIGTALNRLQASLICVQHEYGIFGGPDGSYLLDLLNQARAPVVVTIHTAALDRPSPDQRRVMDAIVDRAARVVTMTADAASIMRAQHGASADKLCIIPHGTHLPPPNARALGRAMLAADERPVMLTFGLLSPGKGIENAIRALPAIASRCPDILYVVLGVTHPNLLRDEGERYRTIPANACCRTRGAGQRPLPEPLRRDPRTAVRPGGHGRVCHALRERGAERFGHAGL